MYALPPAGVGCQCAPCRQAMCGRHSQEAMTPHKCKDVRNQEKVLFATYGMNTALKSKATAGSWRQLAVS